MILKIMYEVKDEELLELLATQNDEIIKEVLTMTVKDILDDEDSKVLDVEVVKWKKFLIGYLQIIMAKKWRGITMFLRLW